MTRDIQRMLGAYETERGRWIREVTESYREDFPDRLKDFDGDAGHVIEHTLHFFRERSRSPLEEIMGTAIVWEFAKSGILAFDPRVAGNGVSLHRLNYVPHLERADIRINARIENFVMDFLIVCRGRTAVVECDSKSWHFGKQKYRDELKDKLVAGLGWRMFRFGSDEIFNDLRCSAEGVVSEIMLGEWSVPASIPDPFRIPDQDEIAERVRDGLRESPTGSNWRDYCAFLDFEHAREFLRSNVTSEDWSKFYVPRKRVEILYHMEVSMDSVWSDIRMGRGFQADRAIGKLIAHSWLIGDTKFSDRMYEKWKLCPADHGKEILTEICLYYWWNPKRWL